MTLGFGLCYDLNIDSDIMRDRISILNRLAGKVDAEEHVLFLLAYPSRSHRRIALAFSKRVYSFWFILLSRCAASFWLSSRSIFPSNSFIFVGRSRNSLRRYSSKLNILSRY
jgi:hypothetical protein